MALDRRHARPQIDALTKGEIDYIEAPPHDLLPLLQKDPNIELLATNPYGRQYAFRFNTLHKPFDNPKIRQAVAYALNGKDFLDASIGNPKWYRECRSLFPCGSPLESTAGWEDKGGGNAAKARQLLQEAGYDGTPVVLMQQTDIAVLKDSGARRAPARSRGQASRSTCSRWTGRRWSRGAPRRTRPRPAAGTPS